MSDEKTIAKLKQFVEEGIGFGRRFQRYHGNTAEQVNCLFHAVFNATNKQLKHLKLNEDDKEVFKGFFKDGDEVKAIANIKEFVERCGLMFEPCGYDDKMDEKSSKVAIFLQDDLARTDFHFFREEVSKNGKSVWSSKVGFTKVVHKDDYLDMHMDGMSFFGCYKVTNPNIGKPVAKEK